MGRGKTLKDIIFFSGNLWESEFLAERQKLFKILYAERYSSARSSKVFTSHPFWEFTVVMNGESYFETESGKIPLEKGSVVLVPPHCRHLEGNKYLDTIWIGFNCEFINKPRHGEIYFLKNSSLANLAEKFWLFSERHFGEIGFEMDGMLMAIIGMFFRMISEGIPSGGKDPIEKAIAHMHGHFSENITFPELSKSVGLSLGYFYRLFKKHTGKTPSDYLASVRVERASRLLRMTDLKICEISRNVGYRDQLYFSRVFKKAKGVSPKVFRNKT
jgi:AraC-like DNA-binding protein